MRLPTSPLLPLAIAVVSAAASCAGTRSAAAPAPVVRRLRDEPPPPPCADPALHTRALARDTAVRAPTPLEVQIAPTPIPRGVHDDTVRFAFRVDSVGRLDTSAVVITGATGDLAYDAKFRAILLRTRFKPAVLEGCSVSGWGDITYVLIGTRP